MAIEYVGSQEGSTGGIVASYSGTFALSGGEAGAAASTPAAGDLSLIATADASTLDRGPGVTGYTQIGSNQYRNDSADSTLSLWYKVMGPTPDTGFEITTSGTTSSGEPRHFHVRVYRGVDPTNPLDVAQIISGQINSGIPDPAAITPVTAGARVVAFGAGAFNSNNVTSTFTSPDLGNFLTGYANGSTARTAAMGSGDIVWPGSGAVDPGAFSNARGVNANDSSTWATIALRPAPTGSTAGNAPGATITATAALVGGAAVGAAQAAGQALAALASFVVGAASGGAEIGGQILTTTAALVAGVAIGAANVGGMAVSVPASMAAGGATGGGAAPGATITTPSGFTPGAASGGTGSAAPGAAITAPAAFVAGGAIGQASAPGAAIASTALLIPGPASGGAIGSASGVVITAPAAMTAGGASGAAAASGGSVTAPAAFLPGGASGAAQAEGAVLTAPATFLAGLSGPVVPLSRPPSSHIARLPTESRVVRLPAEARLARLPTEARIIPVREDGIMVPWPNKDPEDIRTHGLDFAGQLASGEAIASATWTATPPGLDLGDGVGTVEGTEVYVRVAGGSAGTSYVVTCRAVLASSERMDRSARLFVTER